MKVRLLDFTQNNKMFMVVLCDVIYVCVITREKFLKAI